MKFSVTIPAYKSQFLKEAIESVVSQTYLDWELIIVDDCSPEDIFSIVKPYLEDKRIRYYRNDKNCGAVNVVDNWNISLSYCSGDYVICMGDDDRLLPNCLEDYSKLIDKYPTLNVYHTRTEIIDEKGKEKDIQEQRPEWESIVSFIWKRWAIRNKQYIGDFCYNSEYLKKVGGYYKLPLAWGSDDLTAIIAAKDKGIANMQQCGFQYRENSLTISCSTQNARQKMDATLEQYKRINSLLTELSDSQLSDEDIQYLQTIEKPQKRYYFNSLGKNCTDYIKGNPFKLIECYRLLRPLHFSLLAYLKWYLSSIYYLLK